MQHCINKEGIFNSIERWTAMWLIRGIHEASVCISTQTTPIPNASILKVTPHLSLVKGRDKASIFANIRLTPNCCVV